MSTGMKQESTLAQDIIDSIRTAQDVITATAPETSSAGASGLQQRGYGVIDCGE